MPVIVNVGALTPPPPVTAVTLDGRLRATSDPTGGGVLLQADYSAAPTRPYKVRFSRNGVPVRSGYDAWAPGGYSLAYDLEAPLGAVSAWTATPLYLDPATGLLTEGAPTDAVALVLPDLSEAQDFWIKSIDDPSLSRRLTGEGPDPEFGLTGRNGLADIPGSPLLAGSWDVSTVAARTLRFLTASRTERDELLALLGAGPVLVQSLRLYGIDDFYALPGDVNEAYHVGAFSAARIVTVTLVPVSRPSALGAPLYVPGRSYADVSAAFADYDTLRLAKPNYLAVVAP